MITDAQTNKVYFSQLLKDQLKYSGFGQQLSSIMDKHNISYEFLQGTHDIWCRDYMPIQVDHNTFIEYRYDPDYLLDKTGRRLKTYPDLVCDTISLKTVKSDLILDGGNVIKGRNKVILTDKVIPENASKYLKADLLKKLEETFEVEEVILVPALQGDEFGHADGMIRFLDESHVLIDSFYAKDQSAHSLKFMRVLKAHKLTPVYIDFNVKYQSNKNWAYVNFLQTRDILIVPAFGIDEDDQALKRFEELIPSFFPGSKLASLDANPIIRDGGALNCISWNILV